MTDAEWFISWYAQQQPVSCVHVWFFQGQQRMWHCRICGAKVTQQERAMR